MNSLRPLIVTASLILIFVSLTRVLKDGTRVYSARGFAFDTYWDIKVYGGPDAGKAARDAGCFLEGSLTEFLLETSDSALSRLNSNGRIDNPPPVFKQCLELAQEEYDFTGGWFDPTVYALLKAYGFYDREYRIPDTFEVQNIIAERVGLSLEVLTECIKLAPGQKLDLGALVKGFVADRTSKFLLSRDFRDFLVNFGGEVYVSGSRERPWKTGIQDPEGGILGTVKDTGAYATSGSYEKFFELSGRRVTHVFSPHSGKNGSDLSSVTVKSDSCSHADALATALLAMGFEKGCKFAEEKGISALFIDSEGGCFAQGKFPALSQY